MWYMVGIYNSRVRDAIRNGDTPPFLMSPDFEQIQYFDMQATSLEECEKIIEFKWPAANGYVVEYIKTVT